VCVCVCVCVCFVRCHGDGIASGSPLGASGVRKNGTTVRVQQRCLVRIKVDGSLVTGDRRPGNRRRAGGLGGRGRRLLAGLLPLG